jgi:hypothetical protein
MQLSAASAVRCIIAHIMPHPVPDRQRCECDRAYR